MSTDKPICTWYSRPQGKGFYAELRSGKRNLKGKTLWSGSYDPDNGAEYPTTFEDAKAWAIENGYHMVLGK